MDNVEFTLFESNIKHRILIDRNSLKVVLFRYYIYLYVYIYLYKVKS